MTPQVWEAVPDLSDADNLLRLHGQLGFFNWYCASIAGAADGELRSRQAEHAQLASPHALIWARAAAEGRTDGLVRRVAIRLAGPSEQPPPPGIAAASVDWRLGVIWAYARRDALEDIYDDASGPEHPTAEAAATALYEQQECRRWADEAQRHAP